MKFWQSIAWAEAEQLLEVANFAEEVGFHGVVNAEHMFLTKKTQSDYPYTDDGKMNLQSRLDARGVSYENGMRASRAFLDSLARGGKK